MPATLDDHLLDAIQIGRVLGLTSFEKRSVARWLSQRSGTDANIDGAA